MKRLIRSEASLLLAGVFCEFYKKFAQPRFQLTRILRPVVSELLSSVQFMTPKIIYFIKSKVKKNTVFHQKKCVHLYFTILYSTLLYFTHQLLFQCVSAFRFCSNEIKFQISDARIISLPNQMKYYFKFQSFKRLHFFQLCVVDQSCTPRWHCPHKQTVGRKNRNSSVTSVLPSSFSLCKIKNYIF